MSFPLVGNLSLAYTLKSIGSGHSSFVILRRTEAGMTLIQDEIKFHRRWFNNGNMFSLWEEEGIRQ
jgi:hypothetical protein